MAKGWSRRIVNDLASQCGVTTETIYKDRGILLAARKLELSEGDLEDKRAEFYTRLRGATDRAEAAGKWGPVTALMRMEVTVTGLDAPPPRRLEDDDAPEPSDPLEALQASLKDTRRLRKGAERDGTHMAVVAYLKQETDTLAAIEAERRAREAANQRHATEEEELAAFVAGLRTLPKVLLDRVLAQAAEPLLPPPPDEEEDED